MIDLKLDHLLAEANEARRLLFIATDDPFAPSTELLRAKYHNTLEALRHAMMGFNCFRLDGGMVDRIFYCLDRNDPQWCDDGELEDAHNKLTAQFSRRLDAWRFKVSERNWEYLYATCLHDASSIIAGRHGSNPKTAGRLARPYDNFQWLDDNGVWQSFTEDRD